MYAARAEGQVIRLPSALPLAGAAAMAEAGGARGLALDGAGRLWLLGDAGAAVMAARDLR